MPLTDAGKDHIAAVLIGEPVTDYDGANSYLGVGDSSAAFAASQTDLQGTSDRKLTDPGNPERVNNTLTFRATWPDGDAEFAWEEVGLFNASTGGTMMLREVQSLGTKPSGQAWRLTLTVDVENP